MLQNTPKKMYKTYILKCNDHTNSHSLNWDCISSLGKQMPQFQ